MFSINRSTRMRSTETIIWLTAGAGSAQRFLPVSVNPVTGIATIGELQAVTPPVAPTPAQDAASTDPQDAPPNAQTATADSPGN